jgi:hypothetical protein
MTTGSVAVRGDAVHRTLTEREEKAAAAGRHVAPAQRLLPAVIQLTAQFVRAVRNGILGQLALRDVLGSLRMAMFAYH